MNRVRLLYVVAGLEVNFLVNAARVPCCFFETENLT
jgi:hypothetical protein